MSIYQVNTPENYEVVECDSMETDSDGYLKAIKDEQVVAAWAPGFWYGFKNVEVDREQRPPVPQM